jgi:hypothetical protein
MKKVFKMIATLLFIFTTVALMLPGTVSAAASPALPSSINGLPVIFVQTSTNTPSLAVGQRIITLLDNSSSSLEEATNKFASDTKSVKALLKPGDQIEIYGGPGATEAQFDVTHTANNKSWSKNSVTQSYPTANTTNQGNTVSPDTGTQYPGYAYVQDNDTGNTGISVHMAGISPGTSQNICSYFLLNGMTNTGYFMQVGQLFRSNNTCENIYTTSAFGLVPQYYMNLPYVTGDDYGYFIRYLNGSNSNSTWWLGAEDYTTNTFDGYIQYYAQGMYLGNNANTSVWFENYNTAANWYSGFPTYIWAYDAKEYTSSYQWVNWTSNTPALQIGGIGPYSAYGIIYEYPSIDQSASWYLLSAPIYQ